MKYSKRTGSTIHDKRRYEIKILLSDIELYKLKTLQAKYDTSAANILRSALLMLHKTVFKDEPEE